MQGQQQRFSRLASQPTVATVGPEARHALHMGVRQLQVTPLQRACRISTWHDVSGVGNDQREQRASAPGT
jgi:hypothetical protein